MTKFMNVLAVTTALTASLAMNAQAQVTSTQIDQSITASQKISAMTPSERKAKLAAMKDDQKSEIKSKSKAKWDSMTDAQKEAAKKDGQSKWNMLSDTQKDEIRAQVKAHHKAK